MNIFEYRKKLVGDYGSYLKSFINISDQRISAYVDEELDKGALWPEPLLQLNPSFEQGRSIEQLVSEKILHEKCGKSFELENQNQTLSVSQCIYRHQDEAIQRAQSNSSYVLTTGTGSGKVFLTLFQLLMCSPKRLWRRDQSNSCLPNERFGQ